MPTLAETKQIENNIKLHAYNSKGKKIFKNHLDKI